MTTQEAELSTAILLATDDAFRRKFKADVAEGRKTLSCLELLATPSIDRLLLTNRALIGKGREQAFIGLVRAALKNHPLYSVVSCSRAVRGKEIERSAERVAVIKRRCQYQAIKGRNDLITLLYTPPHAKTGLYVDDELLNFSYPGVGRDIQALVARGVLLRMTLVGKSNQNCYLFPNLQAQFEVETSKENPFMEEYLLLCRQFKRNDEHVFEKNTALQINLDVDERDHNYRLPGFLELKKKWKVQQTVKELARQEEDRKAALQEQARSGNTYQ